MSNLAIKPIEVVKNPFSADSLRYQEPYLDPVRNKRIMLNRNSLKLFMAKLNATKNDDRLLVIGVGTGGTIAMIKTPSGSLVPDLNFKAVLDNTDPRLHQEFQIASLDAYSTDSSQLDIGDVGDLAIAMSYICKNMKPTLTKRFAGFLVVHGTDTMAKSGAHLAMMLGKNMPFNVVHTGAQKPINEKINDAQRNVKDGLYTLKILFVNGKAESLTVMGGLALLTTGITKASDFHARAMISPMHRPTLRFDELPNPDTYKLAQWLRNAPKASATFKPIVYRGPNRIGELRAEMNEDIEAVKAMIEYDNRLAFLLVTYGANTYDAGVINEVDKYIKTRGLSIPLFAVSPVNADPHLGVYDVGNMMIKAGVKALYMTPEAARAKLMLALASTPLPTGLQKVGAKEWMRKVQAFMGTSLIGEIPTEFSRRDPYSTD